MAKIEYTQDYALTGYTKDKEVSIWGKLLSYDPNFSTEQIDELKNFINESGGLAFVNFKQKRILYCKA